MTISALESYLDLLLARARYGGKLNALAYCAYMDVEKIKAIESDQSLPLATRKRLIHECEASLGACMRLAAKHGKAQGVADVIAKKRPRRTNQERVFTAYRVVLRREGRLPLIGELLRELGINKPRKSPENEEQWLRVNNREGVIRKMLKKHGLGLSEGKRGRRY